MRMSIALGAATLVVTAAAAILAIILLGDEDSSPAPRAGGQPRKLVVDRAAAGGGCDDKLGAAEAASSRTPWCTLRRAVAAAPRGSVVIVRGGPYPALSLSRSNRKVTLRAARGDPVVLRGLSTADVTGLGVEGFRITGGVHISSGSRNIRLAGNDISPRGVYVRARSSGLRLERNRIHDLAYSAADGLSGYGILLQGSGGGISSVVIKDNRITNIPVDGLQVAGVDDLVVEGNEFGDVRREPDSTAHADVVQFLGATEVTFRSNFVHDSVHGILTSAPTERLRLENNLFVRIQNYALQLTQTSSTRIVNNTFWDNGYGVILHDRATGVTVTNNIFDKFQTGPQRLAYENYNLIASGNRYGPNDISSPPDFVDPARNDYTLAPGSAGIDAGTDDKAPPRDRLGRKRGPGDTVDLGAHEQR